MKITNIQVGICETCAHYYEDHFDPSPAGVALGAGFMIDAGCAMDEKLAELDDGSFDVAELGRDTEHQCPLWELSKAIFFCKEHKNWVWGECGDCIVALDREVNSQFYPKEATNDQPGKR